MSNWCRHYNGVPKVVCEAGVNYHELAAGGSILKVLPCFGRCRPGEVACAKASFFTAAEKAAQETEDAERSDNIQAVRALIMSYVAESLAPGKEVRGALSVCPICVEGRVQFRVDGDNGHVWACCSTPKCVRWQE